MVTAHPGLGPRHEDHCRCSPVPATQYLQQRCTSCLHPHGAGRQQVYGAWLLSSCSAGVLASCTGYPAASPAATAPSLAGIPVTSPASNSVPGCRQHLGQALLGAHDIPRGAECPDSTRLDFCRFEASLEVSADMWHTPFFYAIVTNKKSLAAGPSARL